MDNLEFPANSESSKRFQDRSVERVTTSDPKRKKKSLRKQFTETFIAGDMKSTMRYVLLDVGLTAAKDMVLEMITGGAERLIHGESRRRGVQDPRQAGPTGYVRYNNMGNGSRMSGPQRVMSRMARARFDFDDIILESRSEAEQVIERLFDLVDKYETASVADLYDLVGLAPSHTDYRWGWTDLQSSGVTRVRDGYLLDLPDPHPVQA